MKTRNKDAAAVDRVGTEAIRQHFEVSRQTVSDWRCKGVPKAHRRSLAALGAMLGHPMPEMLLQKDEQ